MSFNTSLIQMKLSKTDKDNYNIIFSCFGADFDEVFELLVKILVKIRTFISVLS